MDGRKDCFYRVGGRFYKVERGFFGLLGKIVLLKLTVGEGPAKDRSGTPQWRGWCGGTRSIADSLVPQLWGRELRCAVAGGRPVEILPEK